MSQQSIIDVLRTIGSGRMVRRAAAIHGYALPQAALTYAQAGEDMAVFKLLKSRVMNAEPGIYVDVGCGAPLQISNTFMFYCFGWRGLCVDANEDHAPAWAAQRPKDVFVCAAVGEVVGSTHLFRHASANWGLARTGAAPPGPSYQTGTPVAVKRLDALLAAHLADQEIQFMSLDVEGAELTVLASNDWNRWRPKAILMESHDFSFDAPYATPPVGFLREQGYRLEGKIGENVLMALDESAGR